MLVPIPSAFYGSTVPLIPLVLVGVRTTLQLFRTKTATKITAHISFAVFSWPGSAFKAFLFPFKFLITIRIHAIPLALFTIPRSIKIIPSTLKKTLRFSTIFPSIVTIKSQKWYEEPKTKNILSVSFLFSSKVITISTVLWRSHKQDVWREPIRFASPRTFLKGLTLMATIESSDTILQFT